MKKFKMTTLLFFASLSDANEVNNLECEEKRNKHNPFMGGFECGPKDDIFSDKN